MFSLYEYQSDYLCIMKTKSILISILSLFVSCSVSRAQFNTIGLVKSKRIHKKKDPHEARQLVPVDSIASADSLTNEFDMEGMAGGVTNIINASDLVLPFIHVSLPLQRIHITSLFGMRHHPILHRYCMHNGVDLKAHYEKVFSMLPGKVVSVGHNKRSGKYAIIQTAGYSISYCHLSSVLVRDGQYVNAGEVVAVSGNTGMSTGPHLHLTIKKDGKVIDPTILLNYVKGMITPFCI
jgi:murein DD-endopeptidase